MNNNDLCEAACHWTVVVEIVYLLVSKLAQQCFTCAIMNSV